jgi:septum formation protein
MTPLILASASPRRAELLHAAGVRFDIDPADVDESPRHGEPPQHYVRRLAEEKALTVSARHPGRAVLGADTVVVVDAELLGKPRDQADARRMLGLLAGRTHLVMTGVCVIGPPEGAPYKASGPPEGGPYNGSGGIGPPEGGPCKEIGARAGGGDPVGDPDVGAAFRRPTIETGVAVTTVEFAALDAEQIDWYVASVEPMDKAGAYAIQGLASRFVTRIDGSYSNVVGLPVELVSRLCTRAGVLLS